LKAIHEIEKLNPKPGGAFTGNNKITENVVLILQLEL
jgi:RNA polymerase sigma-54 factor